MSTSNAAWQGHGALWGIRWAGEVERDRAGRIVAAPSCYGLPHPRGVCPHGHRHRVEHVEGPNMVVDGWYSTILDHATGTATTPLLVSHISAGTGAAATLAGTTALGAEVWRDAVTYQDRNSAIEITSHFYVPEGAVNVILHEFGAWIGGGTVLAARWLLDYDMDAQTSLDGQWTLRKAT